MKSSRHIYGRIGGAHQSRIRALSPAAWYQPGVGVTGTLTVSNWADQSGNGRDLAQGTAGNMPLYLSYSGAAYGYLPGVVGNSFSTPDSAAASVTGDIDIRVKAALDDWTPAAGGGLMTKGNTGAVREWEFFILAGGKFRFHGNGTDYDSTIANSITDAATAWVRATRVAASGATSFYTGVESGGVVTWTQLGTTVTAGAGALTDGTNGVNVGQLLGLDLVSLGKAYRAQMFKTIGSATSTSVDDATASVDFNPSTFAETSTNGTTATMSTGEVWTLNSTGAYPATIVKSSQILGGGVDEFMQTGAFTLNNGFTDYLVVKQLGWTAGDVMASGLGAATAIAQVTATPQIGLNAGSAVAANSNATIGAFVIVTAVFDGANSLLQVNQTTATTGNAGTNNAGGLSFFSDNTGANYWNGIAKERVTFSAAHTAAQRASVQQYLSARHGIAL